VNVSRLSNKVAIMTGASIGIGAGIATALGAAGARVAVNYASDREGAKNSTRRASYYVIYADELNLAGQGRADEVVCS